MKTAMADPLYRLLAWLSPAYPIGAFSYSHGVETAVEEGFIRDRASLVAWLESVLLQGTGAVDGALFAAAWRVAASEDLPAFDAIAERAAAWRGTMEMALESRQQGGSFLSITRTAWPHARLAAAHARRRGGRPPGRPPVPRGQTDAQLALAALERAVNAPAQAAMVGTSLDDVGTAVPLL